jgi:4-amino-4-deoxy-L-arabinose transferase-like glycosyltransferase
VDDRTRSTAVSRRLTACLLAVVLALSALVQFTTVAKTVMDNPLRADASDYFSYAFNLRHHATYSRMPTWNGAAESTTPGPDAVRTPGYPLFLNLVGDPAPTAAYEHRVLWVQAVLGVLSVLLTFLIARRFLGPAASLSVAAIVAISPHLAMMSAYLLTESLFVFLLLATVWLLMRALDAPAATARFVLCGLVWGACCLVRPVAQFLPLILLAAVFVWPGKEALRKPALIGFAAFMLVMAPWFVRNQALPKTPVQPSLVINFLHHGSYPGFMYNDDPASLGIPYRFDPDSERISRDIPGILRHIVGHFRTEPAKYLRWYLLGKPGTLFAWDNIEGVGDIYIYYVDHSPFEEIGWMASLRSISHALHWPLVLLGAFSLMLVFWRPQWLGLTDATRPPARLAAAIVLYAIAFHIIGAPYPRYGIPFRPLLFALALLPPSALWRKLAGGAGSARSRV